MSKLKRGYLNSKEENYFMMASVMLLFITGDTDDTKGDHIVNRFADAGMLTATSQKNLKSGITFMSKFLKETYDNLDKPNQKKLDKKLETFYLKFVNKYEFEKISRDMENKKEFISIKRELFEKVADVLGQECVNCKKDYKECDLYNVFDDALHLSDGECINCKYACEL